jgi:hypothetical protein
MMRMTRFAAAILTTLVAGFPAAKAGTISINVVAADNAAMATATDAVDTPGYTGPSDVTVAARAVGPAYLTQAELETVARKLAQKLSNRLNGGDVDGGGLILLNNKIFVWDWSATRS